MKLQASERLRHRCFPVNWVKFLVTSFFTEHLRATACLLHLMFLVTCAISLISKVVTSELIQLQITIDL